MYYVILAATFLGLLFLIISVQHFIYRARDMEKPSDDSRALTYTSYGAGIYAVRGLLNYWKEDLKFTLLFIFSLALCSIPFLILLEVISF